MVEEFSDNLTFEVKRWVREDFVWGSGEGKLDKVLVKQSEVWVGEVFTQVAD